jgi:hypothetical protein
MRFLFGSPPLHACDAASFARSLLAHSHFCPLAFRCCSTMSINSCVCVRAQAKAKAIAPHQESLLLAFLHVDKVKIYTLQCDIWPQL